MNNKFNRHSYRQHTDYVHTFQGDKKNLLLINFYQSIRTIRIFPFIPFFPHPNFPYKRRIKRQTHIIYGTHTRIKTLNCKQHNTQYNESRLNEYKERMEYRKDK